MTEGISGDRLIEIEARVHELEARLNGVMSVVATLQPVGTLLASYGVPDEQQQVFYEVIDEMSARLDRGAAASFTEFEEWVASLIAPRRGDRRFVGLLIEALRVERPGSRRLCDQFATTMALFRS